MNQGIFHAIFNCFDFFILNFLFINFFSINKKQIGLAAVFFMILLFWGHYALNIEFSNQKIAYVILLVVLMMYRDLIRPNAYLILFCSISFFTVSMNYYVLNRLEVVSNGLLYTYKNIVYQYIWVIPLIFLPTIYALSKSSVQYFYCLVGFFLFILSIYLAYYGFYFDFNRGEFALFFNPVISYDIGFISLGLIALVYAFSLQNRTSYALLVLSLITIFLLILHGSRGTWLGLPLIFILITWSYYKTALNKICFMWAAIIVFLLINFFWTTSPIFSRIEQFQDDTHMIFQSKNYVNSTGIRFYLWHLALEHFSHAPFNGVGMYQIEQYNCQLYQLDRLPQCFQHLHSVYFHELAANGISGLMGLLITYCSALIFFFKTLFIPNAYIKNMALSGIAIVLYYMSCGLTEYYLFFTNTTFMFYFLVASLMSFILIAKK